MESSRKQEAQTKERLNAGRAGGTRGGASGGGGSGGPSGDSAPNGRRRLLIGAAVAAMAIAGVAYFGLGGAGEDHVSDQQNQEWSAAFLAAQPIHLSSVAPSEVSSAIAQMHLASPQAQAMTQQVQNGEFKLIWVTLWDTMAEDGDTVQLDSGGYQTVIKLKNAKQTVAVPAPSNGLIVVTGVFDGGGGITVGMISGGKDVDLPVMDVGQVLGVPVTVDP